MQHKLTVQPLTAERFAPFGDVIEASGDPSYQINRGRCGRYHDLAQLEFEQGRAGISLFRSEPYALPFMLELVERHPLGSQAFLPLSSEPYLVIVAADQDGVPGQPLVLLASPGQGVNYHRGTWHAVLTPLHRSALFAVVDRIGDGNNLEEYWFDTPYRVEEVSSSSSSSVIANNAV